MRKFKFHAHHAIAKNIVNRLRMGDPQVLRLSIRFTYSAREYIERLKIHPLVFIDLTRKIGVLFSRKIS
ncbi:TPA: hypothetical protein ACGTUS_004724, partial [Salmonella enterica]